MKLFSYSKFEILLWISIGQLYEKAYKQKQPQIVFLQKLIELDRTEKLSRTANVIQLNEWKCNKIKIKLLLRNIEAIWYRLDKVFM